MTGTEAVASGAQLLDEKYPGWYDKIDLEALNIMDGCSCICGQLGEYERMEWDTFSERLAGRTYKRSWDDTSEHREWADFVTAHGFIEQRGEVLPAWKDAILARREADKLGAPPAIVEEREVVRV